MGILNADKLSYFYAEYIPSTIFYDFLTHRKSNYPIIDKSLLSGFQNWSNIGDKLP